MITGSVAGDLTGLTPLILGTFVFLTVLLFRKQIKGAIDRAKNVEARRNGLTVKADLSTAENDNSSEESQATAKPPKTSGEEEESSVQSEDDSPDTDETAEVRSQMLKAFSNGDEKEGEDAYQQLQSIESDPKELKLDQARRLAFRFMGGIDPEGIASLEGQVEDRETRSFVYRMIGMCFESAKQPSKAAEAYGKSAEAANDALGAAHALVYKSRSLAEAGEAKQGIDELVEKLAKVTEASAELVIWDGLAWAYKKAGEIESRAFALHQAAVLAGNDARRWFQAGYAYSDLDGGRFNYVVIYCYLTALTFDPNHEWAKNNLGVALRQVSLPIPSTRYYKEAVELGNSLAMANLALLYLGQGFEDEAETLLEKGARQKNPDDKVASVAADLTTRRADQNGKLREFQENAPQMGEYLAKYGQARIKDTPTIPARGELEGGGDVVIESSGDNLTIAWSGGGHRSKRRFVGVIRGSSVLGKFETEGFSPAPESVNWDNDGSGFCIICEEGATLELMKLASEGPEYFVVKTT